MTEVFVLAHGAYWEGEDNDDPGGKWTRVPNGVTMRFYAEPDENLLPMNALEVLMGRGAAGAIQSCAAGERIPNYCFSPLEEDVWMLMLGGVQDGQDVRFIGRDGLDTDRLCLSHGDCTVDGHSCPGLFAMLPGASVIHLLTCRVGPISTDLTAADATGLDTFSATLHIPGETADDPRHYARIEDLATQILTAAQCDDAGRCADPENAQAGALFDQLSEVDKVKLMHVQQVRIWSYVRYARLLLYDYDSRGDRAGFRHWIASQDQTEREWYATDPVLLAAM